MSMSLVDDIVRRCSEVLPARRPLPLHEPVLGDSDERMIAECLRSGWVSSAGPFVDRFEADLCHFTGAHHAVAVVNGTAALHAAIICAGVQAGDEVLAPALTFVATANAIAYCGAVPHFVDAAEATLGVDSDALDQYLRGIAHRSGEATINRTTERRISALVVMHTFGHPVDLDAARAVAERWRLTLIEDAAESLGSWYKNRHTGTIGTIGTLSFNGNKIVTTGGGGAILTDDATIARRARHLCTTARVASGWEFVHDQVGYNYRMPSLNAALGCAQLHQLPRLLDAKRELAKRYEQAFAGFSGARLFTPLPHVSSNHWLNTLVLDDAQAEVRDSVLQALNREGMIARPAWTLMHDLPMYKNCPRMRLDVAERLVRSIVNLPSGPALAPNFNRHVDGGS